MEAGEVMNSQGKGWSQRRKRKRDKWRCNGEGDEEEAGNR